MTDSEIQAQTAKQIQEKFALLSAMLRITAEQHGPVIRKTLNLVADDIDQLA